MPRIECVDVPHHPAWEAYVAAHPRAVPSHRLGWLRAVERAYGLGPLGLVARRDGEVVGVLPLVRVDRGPLSPVLVSGACTSYDGPLADDPDVERELLDEAADLARLHGASHLEIKSVAGSARPPAGPGSPWQTRTAFCTFRIPLPGAGAGPGPRWSAKIRRNLRRADEAGLRCERAGGDGDGDTAGLLDEFHGLAAVTMRRLGSPVHGRALYRNVLAELGAAAELHVVRNAAGEALAAGLALGAPSGDHVLLSVSDPAGWPAHANERLYAEMARRAVERGRPCLDLGRSPWDSGPAAFKRHLGAEAVPLYYDYFLPPRRLALGPRRAPELDGGNPLLTGVAKVWRRLPAGLTATVGPHLARLLA